jgi:integrase/recombinase XerD
MGRRGRHTPHPIPGDKGDPRGFPVLVEEFLTDLGVHGYSPATIRHRRQMLAQLAAWLLDRGVTRPVEVTRPMLVRYQRHLFHYRKQTRRAAPVVPQSEPAAAAGPGVVQVGRPQQPRAVQPRVGVGAAQGRTPPAQTGPVHRRGRAGPDRPRRHDGDRVAGPGDARSALLHRDPPRRARRAGGVRSGRRPGHPAGPAGQGPQGPSRPDRRQGPGLGREVLDRGPAPAGGDRSLRRGAVPDGGGHLVLRGPAHPWPSWSAATSAPPGSPRAGRVTCSVTRWPPSFDGGADIRFIQAMLGHADISTTQIYTHVSIRALQAIHAATHPGAAVDADAARRRRHHDDEQRPGGEHADGERPVDDGHHDVEHGDHGHGDAAGLFTVLDQEIEEENRAHPGSNPTTDPGHGAAPGDGLGQTPAGGRR